jgi:hypothetical protein
MYHGGNLILSLVLPDYEPIYIKRMSIVFEVLSFCLVTPEFLGPLRLHTLAGYAERKLSAPMARFRLLRQEINNRILRPGREFYVWACSISLLVLMLAAVALKTKWSLGGLFLIWMLFSLLGVSVLLLVYFSAVELVPYLAATITFTVMSSVLNMLAARDRLRFWIFAIGAVFFVFSKALEWFA